MATNGVTANGHSNGSTGYRVVGQRVRPANAVAKCIGAVRYTSDMRPEGMLHVQIIRSPHARARIVAVHAEEALALPGVVAVLTYKDVSDVAWGADRKLDMEGVSALSEYANYVGDTVAFVAAEDPDVLEDAMRLIRVDYEVLRPVLDPIKSAQPGAEQIHPYGNVLRGDAEHASEQYTRGDLEAGFAEADVVLERQYRQPQVSAVPHEPRGCVAEWDGHVLTLWDSTQHPYETRDGVCAMLGLEEEQVRVIATNVGGGFGVKSPPSRYVLAAALVAMKTGRPARIWFTREEETLDSTVRPGVVHRIKAGITRDGRITAFRVTTYLDNGYWGGVIGGATGWPISRDLSRHSMQLYNKIPNVLWEVYQVRTNNPRSGAYRGRGCAEPLFAVESMLDELSEAAGLDPGEVRIKHAIQTGDSVEYLLCRGFDPKPSSEVGYAECIRQGQKAIGWADRDRRAVKHGTIRRGIGMAGAIHVAGSTPMMIANCRVEIDREGKILLANGQPDQGSEQQTTLRQIVAETLRSPLEGVSSIYADTATCPSDVGPVASRTVFQTGTAAHRAANAAKAVLLSQAAEMLGEAESRLMVEDGRVWLEPEHRAVATLGEVAAFAGGTVTGEGRFSAVEEETYSYGFAACFAEVEVDTETGRVTVLRIVSAHDVGRAINPEIVEGQLEGGVTQGLGYALTEGFVTDQNSGATLNQWFLDLKTPVSLDTPHIETLLVEIGNVGHPFGAKGCGEISLHGVAPAIRNAIYHATGVRLDEIPLTPDRVLAGLSRQRKLVGSAA